MPKGEDTLPVSIRMPRGSVERLRQATGVPFSTLCRLILMQLLRRLEAQQARQLDNIADQIGEIVKELPDDGKIAQV